MRVSGKLFPRPLLGALLAGSSVAMGDGEGVRFFENHIRPALVENCYEWHSVESGKSKGGLRLDSRDRIRAGGDTGPAMAPRDPGASLPPQKGSRRRIVKRGLGD